MYDKTNNYFTSAYHPTKMHQRVAVSFYFNSRSQLIKMDHALEITNKDAINRNEKCHPKGSYLHQ